MAKYMKTSKLGKVNESALRTVRITGEVVLDDLKRMSVDNYPGPNQICPRTL